MRDEHDEAMVGSWSVSFEVTAPAGIRLFVAKEGEDTIETTYYPEPKPLIKLRLMLETVLQVDSEVVEEIYAVPSTPEGAHPPRSVAIEDDEDCRLLADNDVVIVVVKPPEDTSRDEYMASTLQMMENEVAQQSVRRVQERRKCAVM